MTKRYSQFGGRLTQRRKKVVIDTGVLISAFAFGGLPEKAVRKAFLKSQIYVSPPILHEYRDVPLTLESDRKINHNQAKALISGIAAFVAPAKIVYPKKRLYICRDPENNMLLECCLEAKADFLITGDKDLLDIKDIPFKLQIMTPAEFFKKLF